MSTTRSQTEQRAALLAAFERFVATVEQMPDDDFLRAVDDRTPRDIVAHLIGWQYAAIATGDELRRGVQPAWMGDGDPEYRRVNGESIATYPSRDKAVLLGQLRASVAAYDAMLRDLPADEWEADRGVAVGDWPVTNANLAAALSHEFDHHRGEIERW